MARDVEVRIIGSWSGMIRALDGDKMRRRLERQLQVAHNRMGRQFVRNARRAIRARQYAPNSPITVILKGSSTPLVDKGDLFQSITFDRPDPWRVRVGLIRQKAGEKILNLGIVLHEGATIDTRKHPNVRKAVWAKIRQGVSPERMRTLNRRQNTSVTKAAIQLGFRRRKRKLTAKQVRFLFATGKIPRRSSGGTGTGIWRIPARPFLLTPLNDPGFVRFTRDTWAEAVRIALFPPGAR